MSWKILKNSEVLTRLKELEEYQWYSYEDALSDQSARLNNLLQYAIEHIPYYRRIALERGIRPSTSTARASLRQFPLLTKEILSQEIDDLQSQTSTHRYLNHSGGSTGEPTAFYQDRHYLDYARATKMLFDQWTGYRIGSPKALLWGSERDLFEGRHSMRFRLIRLLKNERCFNAFRMGPTEMLQYARSINRFKPAQILAYAESIYEFARFIQDHGVPMHSPNAIMSSAGTLFPNMRSTIERVFRSPVFNRYGSREVGDAACECEMHEGLHVCLPTHFIEILRPDGRETKPGEQGEIVVTSLTNFTMPFIRYRIGDMGSWSDKPCSCGRSWPLLKKISGRITDSFRLRNGGVVSPEYFIHLLGVVLSDEWLLKFQVVQEDYEDIRILLCARESEREIRSRESTALSDIADKIRLVMGPECNVSFEFVREIPPTASGKYRYTMSHVSKPDLLG